MSMSFQSFQLSEAHSLINLKPKGIKFLEFLHVDSNLSMVLIHFTFSSLECLQCVTSFFSPDIMCCCQNISDNLFFPPCKPCAMLAQIQKELFLLFISCFQKPVGFTKLCVQFSSVARLCQTLCDPMHHSTPGLPVHHQLPEFTQTHVRRVRDAIQPSHPLSSPSPPAPNPSQHQSLSQ